MQFVTQLRRRIGTGHSGDGRPSREVTFNTFRKRVGAAAINEVFGGMYDGCPGCRSGRTITSASPARSSKGRRATTRSIPQSNSSSSKHQQQQDHSRHQASLMLFYRQKQEGGLLCRAYSR